MGATHAMAWDERNILPTWKTHTFTLPETNIAMEITIFPGKYHQNGGFSMGKSNVGKYTIHSEHLGKAIYSTPTVKLT